MISDPISDLIIRIKNASSAKLAAIEVPYTKFVENVAQALKKAGYLAAVEKKGKDVQKSLELGLVYLSGDARVHDVERLSKPSRRMYWKSSDIRSYKSGYGNAFLSTPKGVLADVEAKKLKVGGEVLFRIW
ncbi:MAG: 30S ribosomal protein S8 [Patescibacteria group bacterium]|nr:30S ribosomal protein S8 [Patescibacteria group bacterium]